MDKIPNIFLICDITIQITEKDKKKEKKGKQGEKGRKNKTKVESYWLGRLLKSPLFIVQRPATPKYGVECLVGTFYDNV